MVVALAAPLAALLAGCNVVSQAQNTEGVKMYLSGYYDGALQRFQQAIATDPNDPEGYYNLAATYHKLGVLQQNPAYLDQAESLYNQCLDRSPNNDDCYRALAVLLVERGRSDQAFRLLQGWAQRSPQLADPHIELARLYHEGGEREQAKQQLLSALEADPWNSRALAALGRIREELGDPQQALRDYERALYQDRFQPELAARVASLRNALYPATMPAAPGLAPTAPLYAAPPTTPPGTVR